MARESSKCLVIVLVAIYLGATILLYLSMSGTDWTRYTGGHSGLWHNCNDTAQETETEQQRSSRSKKDDKSEDCHFITVHEAPDFLHVVRAFYTTGFIVWCLSLLYRRLSWRGRGTSADYVFIGMVIFVIVCVATASGVYSLYHHKEFVDSADFTDVRYSYNLHLSIAGCCCLILVILLTVINYIQNINNSRYYGSSCMRALKDCRCYCCLTSCKRPSSLSSSSSSSVGPTHMSGRSSSSSVFSLESRNDNNANGAGGRRSSRRLSRDVSTRRLQISTIGWFNDFPDTLTFSSSASSTTTTNRGRIHRIGLGQSRVAPSNVIVQPPSYEEVSRDQSEAGGAQAQNFTTTATTTTPPPPSYEEATVGRELILSPPPAYAETVLR